MKFKTLAKTALRDSRKSRGRLVMFMSSIVLGIAALVAINSFNYNVARDVDRQAASLLGADLVTSGNREASEDILQMLDSLPGEQATELDLLSMAYLPKADESQFVRIKALEGNFPFYGQLKTTPVQAAQSFQDGRYALVEEGLMLQHELNNGDSIKLGNLTFEIVGRLQNVFGGNNIGSGFAPAVYIGKQFIPATDLVQPGSLVNYNYYQKLPEGFDVETWRSDHRDAFRIGSMGMDTIKERKEDLSAAFDGLNTFLNLVALVALLLGCIGVASSVFIYVKSKVSSIAVFRCLGMKGRDAFTIYFLQILVLGFSGAVIGALLGSIVQVVLPRILSDFMPFDVSVSLSWTAILEGLTIGTLITILFALLPLIAIRKISPLRTLRVSSDDHSGEQDPLRWVVIASIGISLFLFLWHVTKNPLNGLALVGGLFASFLILFGTSKLIMWAVKKFFPRKWNFVLRQGIANLYRPNNQTSTLLISIGLGTSVLTMLFIIQGMLLRNVASMDAGAQPNMILFGIENAQKEALATMTRGFDMPVIQQVPIVTMRLEGWQGKTKTQWLADSNRTARGWAIHREARVSYRDTLDDNETLVMGAFAGTRESPGDSIFISLGESYAEALDVDIGDELVFNVQGTLMKTYVSSFRKIDFANMNTRFFIVFPTGVLEQAPQFQVLVTKSPDIQTTAQFRRDVVKAFPNVSVIDLGMILETVGDILNKVSYIIKFMAAFSILTGLIVLLSSLLLSKFQRIQESVLLRTLGASRKQILRINATEYALLGALSAAIGILIALLGSYLLARFQLEVRYSLQWLPIVIVFISVTSITTIIGLLNTRDVVRKSPLEVLRKEVG